MNTDAAYTTGREIARGGMGAVVDARDNRLGRSVAMKVMLHREAGAAERQRFTQEARVLSQLAHPNIVPVYDLGADAQGRLFYTMKLVQGATLHEVIGQLKAGDRAALAKYPLNTLLNIFQKVCEVVAFAHSRGILHRDLKPQNIMLGIFGEVLVMDWGLAKILPGSAAAEEASRALPFHGQFNHAAPSDARPEASAAPARGKAPDIAAFSETVADGATSVLTAEAGSASRDSAALSAVTEDSESAAPASAAHIVVTLDGAVVGTPHYMSPEQAQGRVNELDARSDIFSLGAILYELLALRPPVEGKTLDEVLERIRNGIITPPSSRRAAVPGVQPQPRTEALEAAKMSALPHIPSGQVPAALSAVVMKALKVDKSHRYQSVATLSAEVAAYQGGFATAAEEAGALTQLLLLLRRHRTATASLAMLLVLSVGFVLKLMSSEQKAKRQEGVAQANERQALAEKEVARQALTRAALALAEAGLQDGNGVAMQAALQQVPPDFRDATWNYLLAQSDTSIARVSTGAAEIMGATAHPRRPGVFAVADSNHKITLLEVRTGARLLEFQPDLRLATSARFAVRLAFSPDGERIAVGHAGRSGSLVIHSAQDGKRLVGWAAPMTERLEFSPDGNWLLQTERTRTSLKLWDATTGRLCWNYEPVVKPVHGVFTPQGQVLTHSMEDQLRLVQAQDGALVRQIRRQPLESFIVRPDGSMLVGVLRDGGIQAISLNDGAVLFEIHSPHAGWRSTRSDRADDTHLAFTPDGGRFVGVVMLPDGRQAMQLWDATKGIQVQSLQGGSGRVRDIKVHPLSSELLICGAITKAWDLGSTPANWVLPAGGGSVGFWGADDIVFAPTTGKGNVRQLQRLEPGGTALLWKPPTGELHHFSATADGRFAILAPRRFASDQNDYAVFFLRQPGSQIERVAVPKPSKFLDQIRISPAGDRWAAIQAHYANAVVYGRDPGQPPTRLDLGGIVQFSDLGWLGNQRLVGLATARASRGVLGSEEHVVLWDTVSGKIVHTVTNHSAMDVLVVAPDGRRFAEAGEDKKVRIRDADTLQIIREFRTHNELISALAWHPAKPILATASTDLSVKLWDVEVGQQLRELRGPTAPPVRLDFSPSGKHLISASINDAVRIWEIK